MARGFVGEIVDRCKRGTERREGTGRSSTHSGVIALTITDEQQLHAYQLRVHKLGNDFRVLSEQGVLHAAIADELRFQGNRSRAAVHAALDKFKERFNTEAAQRSFVNGIVERILTRLYVRRNLVTHVRNWNGWRRPNVQSLASLNYALGESPHTGFAELELYVMNMLLYPPDGFVEAVVSNVPALVRLSWWPPFVLSPRGWDRLLGRPRVTNAAQLRASLSTEAGFVGLLQAMSLEARDYAITSNLLLYTLGQLKTIRHDVRLSTTTGGLVDDRIRELQRAEEAAATSTAPA